MGIEAELRAEYDRSERRETAVITLLPYALLAVSTMITVARPVVRSELPLALGLTAATALWLAGFLNVRPQWQDDARKRGVYFAGLMLLSAGLVAITPFYGIFAFVGYVHTSLFLTGRWQFLGAAATSMIMATAYLNGPASITADGEWWLWAAVSLVSTAMSATFIRFADASYTHGRRQRDALAELHEANVKLEAALEENAGLHAQLVVQAREAGVLDERQRIARDIHDTLAQSLAGILTQLAAADQTMADPAASRRHMSTAMNLARESLAEARRTVHAVQPQVLAEARLPEAINDVAMRWSEAHGVRATMITTGDPCPLHTEIEVALLRTAQEALANVAKHADATRVGLTLSYMEDLVTLDVRDDGVGFDPGAVRGPGVRGSGAGGTGAGGTGAGGTGAGGSGAVDSGFGLAGMRQRVQRLAGRLVIESELGGGTVVSASLPAIPAVDGAS